MNEKAFLMNMNEHKTIPELINRTRVSDQSDACGLAVIGLIYLI